ncbi:MAG: Asp-tRNA(Asn)/Glu-tRNA(Gln) amidotransferase subunit GatC [Treponema sp.]|jgi:aspartyl-tRNA(Asn)/glutamyl-tRNA(Gln) amidotransferase subunit C|nr:Asp-tRNA(Asn)/Glu-tRNA(Gln) amidotransferase subunit GatC [Treponema sp.]
MIQIDGKLISYLEDLSCLTLSCAEKDRLSADLQKILDYFSRLNELDTEGVQELNHPWDFRASAGNPGAFRDDTVCPSLERGLLLKNAPLKNDEMFIAPKTVE